MSCQDKASSGSSPPCTIDMKHSSGAQRFVMQTKRSIHACMCMYETRLYVYINGSCIRVAWLVSTLRVWIRIVLLRIRKHSGGPPKKESNKKIFFRTNCVSNLHIERYVLLLMDCTTFLLHIVLLQMQKHSGGAQRLITRNKRPTNARRSFSINAANRFWCALVNSAKRAVYSHNKTYVPAKRAVYLCNRVFFAKSSKIGFDMRTRARETFGKLGDEFFSSRNRSPIFTTNWS